MKMIKLILILSLFTANLKAPPPYMVSIPTKGVIRPYEALWRATCIVESGSNPYAIGDKHLNKHSYGIAGIRDIRLLDYYQHTGIRYTVTDMFDVAKSKEVFMYYCNGTNIEYIARNWNGGNRGFEKDNTIKYWNLIKTKL